MSVKRERPEIWIFLSGPLGKEVNSDIVKNILDGERHFYVSTLRREWSTLERIIWSDFPMKRKYSNMSGYWNTVLIKGRLI